MATDYNPDNTETDYIDDNAAESQYKEDTKTHLRDVTKGIETDKSDEDTDTTEENNRTTTKKTEETTLKNQRRLLTKLRRLPPKQVN